MEAAASSGGDVEEASRAVRCDCKNSCQRVGKCPCRTEGHQCTELCSCGTSFFLLSLRDPDTHVITSISLFLCSCSLMFATSPARDTLAA